MENDQFHHVEILNFFLCMLSFLPFLHFAIVCRQLSYMEMGEGKRGDKASAKK